MSNHSGQSDKNPPKGRLIAAMQGISGMPLLASAGHTLVRPEAAHWARGLALIEQRKFLEAAAAFREVLRLDPKNVEAHFHLGSSLANLGRGDEAVEHYQRGLKMRPRDAGALNALGLLLKSLNRPAEAVESLRLATNVAPTFPELYNNLGVAFLDLREWKEAESAYRRALELKPAYPEAQTNLATCYVQQGRLAEAVEQFQMALALQPKNEPTLNNLGAALSTLKRFPDAVAYLRQALAVDPTSTEAYTNLGIALSELGRFREAEAAYESALQLKPSNVEALTNLADFYANNGRYLEAFAGFDIALWHNPNSVTAHFNLSMALLSGNNYRDGFKEFEWRWRRPKTPMRPFAQPMWDGSDLTGRRILLWPEQGLGDSIQFIRYAAMAKARGAAQVIFECPDTLSNLFQTCGGIDLLLKPDTPAEQRPDFDVHAPLMSLPRIMQTTSNHVPAGAPYLSAGPELVADWRRKFADVKGLKIGIVWQGNRQQDRDHHRSMPLKHFERLASLKDVRLFSLQRGYGTEQIDAVRSGPLASLSTPLDAALAAPVAMSNLAALMANMDLIVTIDTAVAHLAGALGRPVWVMLSRWTDWRYQFSRKRTPWYPSMRLFRQRRLDQWVPVVEKVSSEIQRLQRKHAIGIAVSADGTGD